MPKSWSTRREARTQPFTQYDETGLQALLDSFEARMTKLNNMYLRLMGEHIADIGTLWPSDVHRLQQIRRMNKNLHDIERRIAEVAGQSREEIEALFQKIAQEDVRMAGKILGAPDTVNVKDNLPLQRILRAQARETAGRMTNLSNSTALSGKYRDAVDVAVNAVQSGVEDYGSAIRRVIREAGQSGLRVRENGTRVVDYESGRSVRIDTAARMSVLDGVRHLNQSVMEEVGRQFGADGVEIDAHMLCAEDHVPYQGGQYSNEEFEQIQDSLQRPFGEWNCRHSWHPIMMGISPKTYSDDELSEMRRYSTEPIEIDGRTKTRYQWSQEMRRVETRIRQVKDTATLARYAEDDVLRRQCQQQIGILNERYTALAQGAGLKPEYQRTYVAGFRDAKDVETLTNYANRVTMYMADGNAVRNMEDLSQAQIEAAIDYAVSLGMPRENICYSSTQHTGYTLMHALDGDLEILMLAPDLYPNPNGTTANELVSWKGTIAHEIIGHRATCLRGTNGPYKSTYDEAQASIRASKFAKGLTEDDRNYLMQDARDRIARDGLDFDTFTKDMDIWKV